MLNTLSMVALTGKQVLEYNIVPTMFDRRTRASRESLEYLQEHYHKDLWQGVIPVDTKFREASSMRKTNIVFISKFTWLKCVSSFTETVNEQPAFQS